MMQGRKNIKLCKFCSNLYIVREKNYWLSVIRQ